MQHDWCYFVMISCDYPVATGHVARCTSVTRPIAVPHKVRACQGAVSLNLMPRFGHEPRPNRFAVMVSHKGRPVFEILARKRRAVMAWAVERELRAAVDADVFQRQQQGAGRRAKRTAQFDLYAVGPKVRDLP